MLLQKRTAFEEALAKPCVKCGEERKLLDWVPAHDSRHGQGRDLLQVSCTRCKYTWFIVPADRYGRD